jgi:hypothetical protein
VALPNLLFCIVVIAYTARQLGVSAAAYATAWLRPGLACVVATAVWLGLGSPEVTWVGIATTIAAGLAPYMIVVAAFEMPRLAATRSGARELCARTASLISRRRFTRSAPRRG